MKTLVKFGLALAAATAIGSTAAKADLITVTIQEDAGPVLLAGTGSGVASILGATTDFNIAGTATDNIFSGNPNLLASAPIAVGSTGSGTHTLTIIVTATNLTSFVGANGMLSSFRLDPVTTTPIPTATVQEFTLFNGVATGATATFNQLGQLISGSSGPTLTAENMSAPFSVTEEYIITTTGNGQFNAGINTSAVPGPIVGAGLPGLIAACGGLLAFARRRRQNLA